MADTLRLTQQCPSGGCYTITDRGTLQQLIANGAITALPIAMDAAGRGRARRVRADGQPVPRLRAEPGQGPGRQDGGRPRVPGLPHRRAASRSASRASRRGPAGILPGRVPGRDADAQGTESDLRPAHARGAAGRSHRPCPARARSTAPAIRLSRFTSPLTARTLDSATTGRRRERSGSAGSPTAAARLFLTTTRFRDLSPLRRALGAVRVRAAVRLRRPRVRGGGKVVLSGRAWPVTGRRRARLVVLARPAAGGAVPGGAPRAAGRAAATASGSTPGSHRAAGMCGCATSIAASWRRDDPPGGPCSSADRDGGVARRRRARGARGARRGRRRAGVRPRGADRRGRRSATAPTSPPAPTRCAARAASATPSPIRRPSRSRACSSSPGVAPDALSFVSIRRPNGTLTVLRARDLARPAPFPDGPPLVWLDADSVRFLRPVRDDADVNGADNIATAGEDLVVRVQQGPLLAGRAPRRSLRRRAPASERTWRRASPARSPAPR